MPLIGGVSLLRKEGLTLERAEGAILDGFIKEGIFKKNLNNRSFLCRESG